MGQLTNQYVSQSYQGLLKLADSTTGVTGTLQYVQDGLGNNIPIKVSNTQVTITGSFFGDGSGLTGITATVDTGSLVTTSSFNAFTASIDGRVDALEVETGSLQNQINQKLDTGSFNTYTSSNDSKVNSLIASTGSYATTSSLTALSQSIASTDLAQNNRLTSIEGVTGSFASTSSLNSYTLTSSFNSYTSSANGRLSSLESATSSLQNQINQKLDTGSFNAYTSSNDGKVNDLISKTGSYATTGSNNFVGQQNINGSVNVTGSLNITGTVTATSASFTYVNTVYETASVIYSSGSNQLGDASDDTQTLWGTVNLPSGPLVVTGSVTATNFTGSLQGTASYATNALSSSHAIYADTASYYAGTVVSASYAVNADTASIARDVIVVGKCDNTGGLTRGTVVRISGANGDNPLFDSASWSDEASSANVLGMLSEDVAYNGFANIVVLGKVIGLNTDAYPPATLLYLSSSGQYTSTVPTAPSQSVRLGQVLRQNINQGSMYFRADNGYELGELHNVIDTATTTGELLSYVSGSYGLWQNKTFSQLGLATTSSVNEKLNTSSFNSYTASMDARTGSYITTGSIATTQAITGSLIVSGSESITGSLGVRNGDLNIISNNTTINSSLYLTSSLAGQSNIILGWGENPAAGGAGANQANYTGSLRITGSNNIVSIPQIRATALGGGAGLQGYISGSNNWINGNSAGIYLTTSSLLFPKTQGNIVNMNASVQMTFTTSSLTAPMVNNNAIFGGGITLNHPSGSVNASANIVTGQITSTQNFVTNVQANASTNNVLGAVTLNHISSSILFTANYTNAPVTVNNHLSSSNITNNSLSVGANLFLGGSVGTGHNIWVSGSQSSNASRTITDNLIGGKNIIISSSFVSSSNANLLASLIYGQNLIVSGSHVGTAGGSAFLGRYNGLSGLEYAQDVVFAVGTGTGTSNRRTGLWITSGSVTNVSGSMNVIGETIMSSSTTFPLYVSGTMRTQRIHFDGNPFNASGSSNLAALRIADNNTVFNISMYDNANIATSSYVVQTVNTGSALVSTELQANNRGQNYRLTLANQSGTGSLSTNVDMVVTGSVNISNVMKLTAQDPLPTGAVGQLAVSSSNELYFHNGTTWNLIS